jgi:hypothetical protein
MLATKPTRALEDYMPAVLEFCKDWLARWIACCLPRQQSAQDAMLREVIKIAKAIDWDRRVKLARARDGVRVVKAERPLY